MMRLTLFLPMALLLGGCLGFGGGDAPPGAASDSSVPSAEVQAPKPATPAPDPASDTDPPSALSPTSDWTMITRRQSEDGALIEFIPQGETAATWTKMASVTQARLGAPASAMKVRRYLFQPLRERCAESTVEVLSQTPPGGGDVRDEAVLICEGFDRTGLPATINTKRHSLLYIDARATRTGYETFQFTWHHDSIPARDYRQSPLFDGEARAWRNGMEQALTRGQTPGS